jgi:hypothetical protein
MDHHLQQPYIANQQVWERGRDYLVAVVGTKQQDTRHNGILSGDTNSAPHPPPMLMQTQKSQLSVGSRRSRGHMYLQSVGKQTLVKTET